MSTKTFNQGFTLIELMISMAVFMVVVGIAVPSMQAVIANNRNIALTNDLISSMHIARSEAIKRGVSVSICPTNSQNFSACGNDWTQGWLVFVNPDGNGNFDNNATEILIRAQQVTNQNSTINPNPNLSLITYTSTGFTDATSTNLSIDITTDGCTGNHGRNVMITFTGRPQLSSISCS